MSETLHHAAQIQCHQNWTTCHSQNFKRVQRDTMGPIHKNVYRSHKSHERRSWLNLWLSVPMEVFAGRVQAHHCLYKRHSQHHCRFNHTAWVWTQCQSNWELLHDASQELKMQSETKLDGSLKTLAQSRNRHQQAWRSKLCVCKSWIMEKRMRYPLSLP